MNAGWKVRLIGRRFATVVAGATTLALLGASPGRLSKPRQALLSVTYDIVYVRAPRVDGAWPRLPDIRNPLNVEPGTDLMLLHPDGTEQVLFAAGSDGAVMDPVVSFDGQWVYFAFMPDARNRPARTPQVPYSGVDIYKKNVQSGQVVQLTQQSWTPPSGAAHWSTNPLSDDPPGTNFPGYGIVNVAPCPLPGGKIMFVSNRDTYLPTKASTFPNLRLYIMDGDGRNVEKIGHLNLGGALHPTVLKDGRVMFSSFESQGLRSNIAWGLWAIWPDGRKWEPLFSAFRGESAMHFQGQRSDGKILVVEYYIQNNGGFGTVLAFDSQAPPGAPGFGSPFLEDLSNPAVRRGIWYFDPSHPLHLQPRHTTYQFSSPGLFAISGFTHGEDEAASRETDGSYAGKVTHPSGAPNNNVLLVWSPGPVSALDRPEHLPAPDAGIYLVTDPNGIDTSRNLVLVKNDPRYNEIQPKALVPYSDIYGVPEPARIPFLPNDGSVHSALPAGTPFGLIGTSSFYKRETSPTAGGHVLYPSTDAFGVPIRLDSFNTLRNGESSNWFSQGADDGRYGNAEIFAVRIVALEGVVDRGFGPRPGGFSNHAGDERLRILGEVPLRKGAGVLDPDGNPDTSFLAKVPADTPFTFQTLDRDGMVLNIAQTWHQVRPGEMRADCGGCHAHSKIGTNFAQTAAAQPGYQIPDLTGNTPYLSKDGAGNTIVRLHSRHLLDVEFHRDIQPLLVRSCASCHSGPAAPARLVLNDDSVVSRLIDDHGGPNGSTQYGIPPLIEYGGVRLWRQSNASRYVRAFQSRRSLLMWKVMGRRLDGWTNGDQPHESVPGDPTTLPPGVEPSDADIAFVDTLTPPHSSLLTDDEKMTFARWIDLGCPVNSSGANPGPQDYGGWFSDELKPTLTVSRPRSGPLMSPLSQIRIGAYDDTSGLNRQSLSVVANFTVNGHPPGTQLGPLFGETAPGSFIWNLNLGTPIENVVDGHLTIKVRDLQGNEAVVDRSFGTGTGPGSGPLIAAVAPPSGPPSGGTPVTIYGSGFESGATVALGGVPATSVFVVNGSAITAVTGAHPTSVVDIVVTNPGPASGTLPRGFFYFQPPPGAGFYTVTPCRIVDTRSPDGPSGGPALEALQTRLFTLTGVCGIPASATSVSANLTVIPGGSGYLAAFPGNGIAAGTSNIQFTAGPTRANNSLLLLATDGSGTVSVLNASSGRNHFVLDVNGYFR